MKWIKYIDNEGEWFCPIESDGVVKNNWRVDGEAFLKMWNDGVVLNIEGPDSNIIYQNDKLKHIKKPEPPRVRIYREGLAGSVRICNNIVDDGPGCTRIWNHKGSCKHKTFWSFIVKLFGV